MKNILALILLSVIALTFSRNTIAHNPPVVVIDTTNFSLKIHGNTVDKSNVKSILESMDHAYRTVVKGNKTLHISDGSGFVIEETENSVAVMLFYQAGTKENEPKSAFRGKFFINNLEVTATTGMDAIKNQLPKTEKTMVMTDALLYLSTNLTLSAQSKEGLLKELDFGFKLK
jgi:hypothetical protein